MPKEKIRSQCNLYTQIILNQQKPRTLWVKGVDFIFKTKSHVDLNQTEKNQDWIVIIYVYKT